MKLSGHFTLTVLALVAMTAGLLRIASAQEGSNPGATLMLRTNPDWGEFLATADGMSVYLYVQDEGGTSSACVEACEGTWPPVLVEPGANITVVDGLDTKTVGTLERVDGTLQLTYGGWPLYHNARDRQPGDVRGQALGGQFFLLTAVGAALTERVAVAAVEVDEGTLATLMAEGQRTFGLHCFACHGAEGQGVVGPRLAGNPALAGTQHVVTRILDGYLDHGMPAFGEVLTDREIAATATFIRNSWGNSHGPVVEEEVAGFRSN